MWTTIISEVISRGSYSKLSKHAFEHFISCPCSSLHAVANMMITIVHYTSTGKSGVKRRRRYSCFSQISLLSEGIHIINPYYTPSNPSP